MTKLVLLLALVPSVAAADKSFTGDKKATWDCAKDPEVSITSSKATFTLTGACKSISVTGSDVKLTIESIADLVLNGDGITATVATLGEVTINGNKNSIVWKKARSGDKPGVQNNGKTNSVTQEKPAPKK